MKKKTNSGSEISVFIVAVLAVMAFVRGKAQIWFLAGIFAVFAVRLTVKYLVPYLKTRKSSYEARRIQKKYDRQKRRDSMVFPDISDPVERVLLRHANFRISAYLQSAYPDATWEWCEEAPEKIIAKGGTGRIRLYGVPDFNFADITVNQNADLDCAFMKVVPLAELNNPSGEAETIPKKQNPIDPQVWYEQQGRTVLESLISDLDSRGHHSLTILENGDIAIKQADAEITHTAFANVSERTYWKRLAKVFEREGIAADVTDGGIVLSW